MKRRYHGLVAIISGVVTLVAIGAYVGSGLWRSTKVPWRPILPAALNIKVPTDQQVRQMERLFVRLDQLALPSVRSVAAKSLTLFGYHDPSTLGVGENDTDQDHMGRGKWQLSLTVQAGIKNYCVIDGKFLAQGARMDDGTQVLKIESHRVLILTQKEQHWIYLEDDLSPSTNTTQHMISNHGKGQS